MPSPLPTSRAWAPPNRGVRSLPWPISPAFVPPPIPPALPAPPLQQQWVLQRGVMSQVAAARMHAPYSYTFNSDATSGTLIFGGSSYDFLSQQGVLPVQQQQWVQQRGIVNRVAAARMHTPYVYTFNADLSSGTLVFGGAGYDFLSQQGASPQQQQAWTLQRGIRDQQQMVLRTPVVQYTFASVFTDVASGNLIWGGAGIESALFAQTSSGTVVFTGGGQEAAGRIIYPQGSGRTWRMPRRF